MSLSKVVTVGTPVAPQARIALGSLPASTNFDQVDVYYDPSGYLGKQCQFTFYLYGTTNGIRTLLKTIGPFGPSTVACRILTLNAEPGTTYSLEGALTQGSVIAAATMTAALVGSNTLINTPFDLDATATPTTVAYSPGTQVTITDMASEHSHWNTRVKMSGAKFPDTTFRAFAVITSGANTIRALVGTVRTSNASAEGFQPFDLEVRADRFVVTAEAMDNRATGANALSISHVTIGSDPAISDDGNRTAYLAQTAWHIDSANGNDNWDGTSVGPIKTIAEYVRRTGYDRPVENPVDIYLYGNFPSTDPPIFTGICNRNGYIFVHGAAPTTAASGTLTAYTAPVAATNTLPQITAAGFGSFAAYVGKLIVPTSGTELLKSPGMWITQIVGADQARVANPAKRSSATDYFNEAVWVPTGTETFNILTLQTIAGSGIFAVDGPASQAGSYPPLRIEQLDFTGVNSTGYAGVTCFINCRLGITSIPATTPTFLNCHIGAFLGVLNANAQFRGGYLNATNLVIQGGCFVNAQVPITIRAGSLTFKGTTAGGVGMFLAKADVAIYGTTNYFNINDGCTLRLNASLYGEADANTMFLIGAAARFITAAVSNIKIGGTSFDVKLAGKTQVFLLDPATGAPGALTTCSLANWANAGVFNGNMTDAFTLAAAVTG